MTQTWIGPLTQYRVTDRPHPSERLRIASVGWEDVTVYLGWQDVDIVATIDHLIAALVPLRAAAEERRRLELAEPALDEWGDDTSPQLLAFQADDR